MGRVSRRLVSMVPALVGVVVCIFLITRVLPGDPARAIAGPQASPSTVAKLRDQMGLSEPLYQQFVIYIQNLLHGDLGFAWHTGHSVVSDLISRVPATVELGVFAILIALVIGIPLGIISALRRDRPIDHVSRVLSLLGASMPLFWLALLVIYFFFTQLGWEPAPLGRIGEGVSEPTHVTGFFIIDSLLSGDMVALKSSLSHIIWPALCLSTISTAIIARMVRSEMLEVISQDYIRTATSKGLPPAKVVLKHAFKNAAPVTLTVVGLQFGQLMGGAVITETIFAWPGVGSYVVKSIEATDYAPVQGFTLLAAIVYLVVNLIVDLTNARLDPRVQNA